MKKNYLNLLLLFLSFLLLVSCVPTTPPSFDIPSIKVKCTASFAHSTGINTVPFSYVEVKLFKLTPIDDSDLSQGYSTSLLSTKLSDINGLVLFDSLDVGIYKVIPDNEPEYGWAFCGPNGLSSPFNLNPIYVNQNKRYYKTFSYACAY
jgi:hypothetical protein